MKTLIENPIVVALLTAFAMWIGGWVRSFLAKRVRVSGPEAEQIKAQGETLGKVVLAVNTLIECKGPELNMLIALGEAMQGKNNGNVTTALTATRTARDDFERFRNKASCIEAPDA